MNILCSLGFHKYQRTGLEETDVMYRLEPVLGRPLPMQGVFHRFTCSRCGAHKREHVGFAAWQCIVISEEKDHDRKTL